MAAEWYGLPEGLLDDVKRYLDVTWEALDTDRKLDNMLRSGMAYLDGKLGATACYAAPGEPRTLLFEYVRYARDAALDVFENNYLSRLVAMRNDRRVSDYAESADASDK